MLRSPSKSHSESDLVTVTAPTTRENVTQRKRKQPESEITEAINKLSADINLKMDLLRSDLDGTLKLITEKITNIQSDLAAVTLVTSNITTELNSLKSDYSSLGKKVSDLSQNHMALTQEVAQLKTSLQHAVDEQSDLRTKINSFCTQGISSDVVCSTLSAIEMKMDTLEQQARNCNVELCNVPDKRNENLITIIESVCLKINFPLQQKDIIAIHRVPHAHKDNNKPKNIIIKLSSRILRDNLLSAFRLAKGINSDQLGLSGNSQRIYMHEHLTLKKKQLFRETREAARKHAFKYVWVKHGTILVRETDSTAAMAIHSSSDIKKIKSGNGSTKSYNSDSQQS